LHATATYYLLHMCCFNGLFESTWASKFSWFSLDPHFPFAFNLSIIMSGQAKIFCVFLTHFYQAYICYLNGFSNFHHGISQPVSLIFQHFWTLFCANWKIKKNLLFHSH